MYSFKKIVLLGLIILSVLKPEALRAAECFSFTNLSEFHSKSLGDYFCSNLEHDSVKINVRTIRLVATGSAIKLHIQSNDGSLDTITLENNTTYVSQKYDSAMEGHFRNCAGSALKALKSQGSLMLQLRFTELARTTNPFPKLKLTELSGDSKALLDRYIIECGLVPGVSQ